MSDNINFFSEEIDFKLEDETKTSLWLNLISENNNQIISNINYVFCNDEYLLNINKEHLNHDYYTDIITFDLSDTNEIESDIFISIDRVKENATNQNTSFVKELNRVLAHGLLHLIGYDDKTDDDKKIMRDKEDSCLSLLKK